MTHRAAGLWLPGDSGLTLGPGRESFVYSLAAHSLEEAGALRGITRGVSETAWIFGGKSEWLGVTRAPPEAFYEVWDPGQKGCVWGLGSCPIALCKDTVGV